MPNSGSPSRTATAGTSFRQWYVSWPGESAASGAATIAAWPRRSGRSSHWAAGAGPDAASVDAGIGDQSGRVDTNPENTTSPASSPLRAAAGAADRLAHPVDTGTSRDGIAGGAPVDDVDA